MSHIAHLDRTIHAVEARLRETQKFFTVDQLAQEVWKGIFALEIQKETLLPLLVEYVGDRDREVTRKLERKTTDTQIIVSTEAITKGSELSPRQKRAKEYLLRTMRIGNGRHVVIALATKRDWQDWHKMLLRQEEGIRATREMASRVIELFKLHGARQTKDIPLDDLANAIWNPPDERYILLDVG